jgi:fatty acid desaturase
MLGLGIIDLLKFMKAVFPSKRPQRMIGPVVLWLTFLALTLWLNCLWIFGLWAWSVVTGFWAVFRVRTWTEHVEVPPCGKETSHRFSAGRLARFFFFPHNTYCHYEHHKWPQVPYYNLLKIRNIDNSRPIRSLAELFPLVADR